MSIQPGSSKLAGRHSVPEIQKKQKSQIKKILLQLLNYQGALSVGYHRQYSFYRRRLFTAYVTMFNVEESNLICIFAGEGRNEVIRDIERAFPYLEDTDMAELSSRVIGKLQGLTDNEFEQLELTKAE